MNTAIGFRVTGRVQGVGFRAFVSTTGRQLGLTGWVKNNSDGSVMGMAEGEHGILVEFMKMLRVGNKWSSVEGIEERPQSYTGEYENFEIRY